MSKRSQRSGADRRISTLVAAAVAGAMVAGAAGAQTIAFTSGPIDGKHLAYTISNGIAVSNPLTLRTEQTITGFSFGGWTVAGSTILSVSYGLSTSPFGQTRTAALIAGDAIAGAGLNAYDVREYRAAIAPVTLAAGDYWFTLEGALTTNDIALWDQNDPSTLDARQRAGGTVFSRSGEAFALFGAALPAVPEPASWAMAVIGFGLAGVGLRTRTKVSASTTVAQL